MFNFNFSLKARINVLSNEQILTCCSWKYR